MKNLFSSFLIVSVLLLSAILVQAQSLVSFELVGESTQDKTLFYLNPHEVTFKDGLFQIEGLRSAYELRHGDKIPIFEKTIVTQLQINCSSRKIQILSERKILKPTKELIKKVKPLESPKHGSAFLIAVKKVCGEGDYFVGSNVLSS